MERISSTEYFDRAKQVIPGGVNSPVRAFGSVGLTPLFIASADGCVIRDVEGRCYTDYVGSWGPMILGHNHPQVRKAVQDAVEKGLSFGAPCPAEWEIAQLVTSMTPTQMVRMVSSGTEAVMSALRLARGYTGRNKLIKFAGCYHGHSDSMLVKAGSGALTAGVPNSAGVPQSVAEDTLTAEYNDLDSVEELLKANPGQVAAVIVEPVAANMGLVLPQSGFLEGLRTLCDDYGALLIFDEVITGFRLAPGGAQEYFNVKADLVTYGKIIGGGMPVGAYGGRKEIMEHVAPLGPVYQAGTLSGNPVAMAAGLAQLTVLQQNPELYQKLEGMTQKLAQGLQAAATEAGVDAAVNQIGSLCCCFFHKGPVNSYLLAAESDTGMYSAYFKEMLDQGVYLAPAQFEAMFVSTAHSNEEIEKTIAVAQTAFKKLIR